MIGSCEQGSCTLPSGDHSLIVEARQIQLYEVVVSS